MRFLCFVLVFSVVQLIELYGEDARLFFLQCLVEETGFKEQKAHAHHGNKDAQKVRFDGVVMLTLRWQQAVQ